MPKTMRGRMASGIVAATRDRNLVATRGWCCNAREAYSSRVKASRSIRMGLKVALLGSSLMMLLGVWMIFEWISAGRPPSSHGFPVFFGIACIVGGSGLPLTLVIDRRRGRK
jgi:hypothetical protein